MSNSSSFDIQEREEKYIGVHEFADGWELKLYLITATGIPMVPEERAKEILVPMLRSISDRMSEEFTYGRFGFAVIHTGKRGVCISVNHFGAWGTTFEVFSSVWYRYGYGFEGFELLDDIEPACCWFEFERTNKEVRRVFDLVRSCGLEEIRRAYLSADP